MSGLDKFIHAHAKTGKDDRLTEVLDDLVFEAADNLASNVNNSGGQIEFLKEQGWTNEDILEELKEALE